MLLGVAATMVFMTSVMPRNKGAVEYSASVNQSVDLLRGQWAHMPGASVQKDGIHIAFTGHQIVQQDGTGGQVNSPVNMYGTHVEFSDGVALEAGITNLRDSASLQLYSKPPIIQDEFRVEPPSIRLAFANKQLTVSVWDGKATRDLANQKPVAQQSFAVSSGENVQLQLTHRSSSLDIVVNGQHVGAVDEHGALASGQIWFGMEAPTAKSAWVLSKLQARPVDKGSVRAVDISKVTVARQESDGLQMLANQRRDGFLIGSAMALTPAVSDAKYANIAFGGNFGSMTTENALKFQFVHPQPDMYTFQEADALVNLARSHHLVAHGHALVFGEANPVWVQNLPSTTSADKARVKNVMTGHITKLVGHFKDRITSWDVVNEPFADYDDTEDGEGSTLRQHLWQRAVGPEYIALAFRTAHQADPKAKLFLNDYGLESDGDRWDALISLVTQLKRDHVPIDGVGFESHVYEAGDKIDPAVLRKHIRQLAALGLKSRVSEMDVYTDDGTTVQAEQYARVLSVCIDEPSCVSFTTWGFDDDYDMWQDDDRSLQHGKDLLWTTGATPTPAVTKLQQLLRE